MSLYDGLESDPSSQQAAKDVCKIQVLTNLRKMTYFIIYLYFTFVYNIIFLPLTAGWGASVKLLKTHQKELQAKKQNALLGTRVSRLCF